MQTFRVEWLGHVRAGLTINTLYFVHTVYLQGGSNMTGTDLYVNKPHCAAAVRP